MVDRKVIKSIRIYLRAVADTGIPVKCGVLFGSYARGQQREWSDIDLLVVSPRYDKKWTRKDWAKLWIVAANTDARIEPIPVGEKQFKNNRDSMVIELARREGKIIPLVK
ncbi:MAG: nucleotidyltransferase domain-containing protein [Chloroflexi bacterium]|nr:nucleotidyltransferase domain-containing protein [Chloroflexota bacterium]